LADHSHRGRTERVDDARPIHAGFLTGDRGNSDANGGDAAGDTDDAGSSLVATPPGHSVSEETAPASHSVDIRGRSGIKRKPGNEQHCGSRGTRTFYRVRMPIVSRNDRCLETDTIEALSLQIERH
jgi:hypothetical protein